MSASSLRVEFATEEEFRREYASNIANGGVFIASEEPFEVRDLVRVQLDLVYCDRRFEFEAEVVHCIPPEMAGAGAQPGVALQFQADAAELRSDLESLAGAVTVGDERVSRSGRRAALRSPVRVPAQLKLSDGSWVAARTCNLSSSGMLLVVPGQSVPVGEAVTVAIRHPTADEELVVDGEVVRHVCRGEGEDEVAVLGIEFDVPASERNAAHEFVSRLWRTEHTRRLGGIIGPIGGIGVESLLAMFGSVASQGTLRLTQGVHEGLVVFENGLFRGAEVARCTGLEALALLLTWQEGTFEFETHAEAGLPGQAPLPLDVAIREAAQERVDSVGAAPVVAPPRAEPGQAAPADDLDLDPDSDLDLELELDLEVDLDREPTNGSVAAEAPQLSHEARESIGQVDLSRLPPDAALSIDRAAVDAVCGDLGKTEEALVDLAAVGLTVAKAMDVIPEPADDVHRALSGLIDRGLILVGS